MSVEANVAAARQRIVETARAMLQGQLSFIEGALRINGSRMNADLPELDPDMVCFLLIDSETDTLPFGTSGRFGNRRHWRSCNPRSNSQRSGRARPAGPPASR